MIRFIFKTLWFLVSFTGRAFLLFLELGADAGAKASKRMPKDQYEPRYSWQERSGYSWTNRSDY
jgi:hypothetical protein